MTSDGKKKVYMKVEGRDQIYNFVVEKFFIWDRYSCQTVYIRHYKVMIKEKYIIVGHMWWCSLVVGNGMRKAKIVGSNPDNARKNHTRAYSRKKFDMRRQCGGKKKIFFWFLFMLQIFILARKRMMSVTYVLT